MNLRARWYAAVAAAVFLIAPGATPATVEEIGNPWPSVAAMSRTFEVPDPGNVSVVADIGGIDGTPLYRLICHDGNYLSRVTCNRCAEDSFPYAGLLQCRLASVKALPFSFWDPDALVSYYAGDSRAVFTTDELVGKCADYPEWGRARHFSMRGMRLTLAITGLVLEDKGGAKSYRLSVNVEPDPGAISAIAGLSQFVEPEYGEKRHLMCESVTHRHVPGEITQDYLRAERLQPPYPKVARIEKTLTFSSLYVQRSIVRGREVIFSQPKSAELGFFIQDESGKPVYEFRCSNAGEDQGVHLDSYGFICIMHPYGREINLLSDSVDPYTRENRAAFDGTRVWQTCGDYPEWGRVRHFELRGMRLTVTSEGTSGWGNIEPGFDYRTHPEIKGPPKIHVKVEPDPAVKAPIALPSRYVDSQFTRRIIDGRFVAGKKVPGPVRSAVTGEDLSGQVLSDRIGDREAHAGVILSASRCIEILTHEPSTPEPR